MVIEEWVQPRDLLMIDERARREIDLPRGRFYPTASPVHSGIRVSSSLQFLLPVNGHIRCLPIEVRDAMKSPRSRGTNLLQLSRGRRRPAEAADLVFDPRRASIRRSRFRSIRSARSVRARWKIFASDVTQAKP